MFIVRFLVLTTLLILPIPSQRQAQDLGRAKKIEAAWLEWVQENNIEHSVISVSYRGQIVSSTGSNQSASDAVPIASLSKAITAVCVHRLISIGKLEFNSTLGDIYGSNAFGIDLTNNEAKDITISQLLTHTSGLKPDITQGRIQYWKYLDSDRLVKTTTEALAVSVRNGKSGQYFYNNGNYAVLGAIISKLAGQSYERACQDLVFRSKGNSIVRLDDKWESLSAFGGWSMSASDYLQFINTNFGRGSELGENPNNFAKSSLGGGGYYGMGTHYQSNGQGAYNFWHFGRLCFSDRRDNAGSFFASWGGDWAVSVNYDYCASDAEVGTLDGALWKAAHQ